jgi:tripartite-type tricarboxylate transporter receptor subunit TctC
MSEIGRIFSTVQPAALAARVVRALRLALLAAAALLPGAVQAQEFPARHVTLVVPWPAGGSTDVVMRILAEATARHLGQPIVIENKPGAGGTLGPGLMAQTAKPDGYTISQIPLGVFRMPHMQKTNYDPGKDFTYIIGVSGYTFGVAVRADAPWKNWKEFAADAKANPDKVNYGSTGIGSSPHLTMEQFAKVQGIRFNHIPYKGDAELNQALLGGQIMAQSNATGFGALVDAGRFRLLVTWGDKRTKRWPDVPTLKELGYGIVSNSPYGVGGPRGLDPKVVKILHDAFKKGMEDPAYQSALQKFDQENFYMNTEEYTRWALATFAEQKKYIDDLGIKGQ